MYTFSVIPSFYRILYIAGSNNVKKSALGPDASSSQVIPQNVVSRLPKQFDGTHLYFWMERGRVFPKNTTQLT